MNVQPVHKQYTLRRRTDGNLCAIIDGVKMNAGVDVDEWL